MRDLVPQEDREYFYSRESYESLVDSFEHEVLFSESVGDYQGDIFFILKDGNRYGWLRVGYGSCSGCDSLEACCNHQEVVSLRDSLYSDIAWYSTAPEIIEYIKSRQEDSYYRQGEYNDCYNRIIDLLERTQNV